jgi:TolA-binding protein
LTRHELKEQLQHDAFRDNVDLAVDYVAVHRREVVRWSAIAVSVIIIAAAIYGAFQYQKHRREQALQGALAIAGAPILPTPDGYGRSFATEQERDTASAKALASVASEYSGSEQGTIAQYYLAGTQASEGKYADAERNFKAAADAGVETSTLAKVGLAELYAGQGRTAEAQTVLQGLIDKPNALVSKEQATVLLAEVLSHKDPKRAKEMISALKGPAARPAVSRAAEQAVADNQ